MALTPAFSTDLTSASHVRNMLSALMTVWPLTATVATVSRPSQRRMTWSASARKSASTWKSREYCQSFWETQRVFSSLSRQSMGGIFPALRRSRWTTPGTVAGRVRSASSCLTCHEPLSESVFIVCSFLCVCIVLSNLLYIVALLRALFQICVLLQAARRFGRLPVVMHNSALRAVSLRDVVCRCRSVKEFIGWPGGSCRVRQAGRPACRRLPWEFR